MRATLVSVAGLLAASCVTASRALDIAANDYAATLEKSAPMAMPEQRACMVRTAREAAFVDTDDDGVSVRLRPSANCTRPDGGEEPTTLGGSAQYRLNSFGHIIERRVMQ